MRISLILIFVLVCLAAVSNAQKDKDKGKRKGGKCDRKCSKQVQPVCATKDKGQTYRKFINNCSLDKENCKVKNAWKKVDLTKCKK